jgi:glyoxylase-like metal-dependent hydrolase (beta-lactamase superfamily II)
VDFTSDHVGPLATYASTSDPQSALAAEQLRIGDRTLLALSDGFFDVELVPQFLGSPSSPHAYVDSRHAAGHSRGPLPVGAFVWTGEQTVLIDAGFGPRDGSGRGILVGGALPAQLRRHGLSFDDIDIVALSHLHADHTGWLADDDGRPLFRRATVQVERGDWDHFMSPGSQSHLHPGVHAGLTALAERGRVELLDGDCPVVPGLDRLAAPGHTPGHSVYVVHDRGDRALLFGDGMYCPEQLTEVDWAATSDVDPVLAGKTRRALLRDIETNGGYGLGCHFPGLRAGRVISGAWVE